MPNFFKNFLDWFKLKPKLDNLIIEIDVKDYDPIKQAFNNLYYQK